MKVLLLTSSCDVRDESILLEYSKCGLQNSIICFQRNMQMGLQEIFENNCDVFNYFPIGAYPGNCRKIFFKGSVIKNKSTLIKNFHIVNIPFIKQVFTYFQVKRAINKWIRENKDEDKIIIMYDLLIPYLMVLGNIVTTSRLKTCTIIADLPNEFGYQKRVRGIKALVMQKLGRNSLEICKKINCFGLLTKQMSDILFLDRSRFVVIEGFSNPYRYYTKLQNKEKHILLYTGAIFKIYGLDILLKAFMNINADNYELWLCGTGDYVGEILEKSKVDNRIKYLGYKSQKEIELLQAQSTLLINPRQNIGEYTKYSFPSKIIEYLSTARPIIAYKLDGIPNEYYNYLIAPSNNSVEELSSVIVKTCELTYEMRKELGDKGRDFILERTNPKNQINKLLHLIIK